MIERPLHSMIEEIEAAGRTAHAAALQAAIERAAWERFAAAAMSTGYLRRTLEANAEEAQVAASMADAMLDEWRKRWGRP